MRERNRLATEHEERKRIKPGYGEFEASQRDDTVSLLRTFINVASPQSYPVLRVRLLLTIDVLGRSDDAVHSRNADRTLERVYGGKTIS